eukprot:symbB.v1.2.002323.t1/scaffold123.1/size315817/8
MPMLETVPALATRLSQPRQSVSVTVTSGGTRPTLPGGQGLQSPSVRPSLGRGTSRGRAASQRGSSPEPAVLAQVAHGATMEAWTWVMALRRYAAIEFEAHPHTNGAPTAVSAKSSETKQRFRHFDVWVAGA